MSETDMIPAAEQLKGIAKITTQPRVEQDSFEEEAQQSTQGNTSTDAIKPNSERKLFGPFYQTKKPGIIQNVLTGIAMFGSQVAAGEGAISRTDIQSAITPGSVNAQVENVPMYPVKAGERRLFVGNAGLKRASLSDKPQTPEPTPIATPTPEYPADSIEAWYLKAQEVPGTRLTKEVNGKDHVLKSLIDPGSAYEVKWKTDFPESIEKVMNHISKTQADQGYDELSVAILNNSSFETLKNKSFFEELKDNNEDGTEKSLGYFGRASFEINGKKYRIVFWSAPKLEEGKQFDEFDMAAGYIGLKLAYVATVNQTPPDKLNAQQTKELRSVEQDYVNIVRIDPK